MEYPLSGFDVNSSNCGIDNGLNIEKIVSDISVEQPKFYVVGDKMYNSKGYHICGYITNEVPCRRIGKCPFHSILEPRHPAKKEKNTSEFPSIKILPNDTEIKKSPYRKGWSREEHTRFLVGLQLVGAGNWNKISEIVKTRTPYQTLNHAQKYYKRKSQSRKCNKTFSEILEDIDERIIMKYISKHNIMSRSSQNRNMSQNFGNGRSLSSSNHGNYEAGCNLLVVAPPPYYRTVTMPYYTTNNYQNCGSYYSRQLFVPNVLLMENVPMRVISSKPSFSIPSFSQLSKSILENGDSSTTSDVSDSRIGKRNRDDLGELAAIISLENRTTIDIFENYIAEAKKADAEIVVFPELSVLMIPENVTDGEIPCENPDDLIDKPTQYRLSKAARDNSIYVALSIFEHGEKCNMSLKEKCLFGFYLYNTEIIFDRSGKIITKYRKAHAFLSFLGDIFHHGDGTPKFFDSDFGVRFGTFVCFDIFFPQPQLSLIEKYGIQNIVFSEDWYDVIPITAVTFVQGWSRHYGVNVLAANCQEKKIGYESTGSGILTAGEQIVWTISRESQMLVADIPKVPKKLSTPYENNEGNNEEIYSDHFKVQNDTFIFKADHGYTMNNLKLSVENVNCLFSFKVTDIEVSNPPYFIAMATSHLFGVLKFESCYLQRCGHSASDCVIANKDCEKTTTTVFDYVEITTQYTYPDEVFMALPVAGTNDKALFQPGQFEFTESKDVYHLKSTAGLHEPLLFIGHAGLCDK